MHGFVRRSSVDNLQRIRHLLGDITLHYGDITDFACVYRVIRKSQPHEIYNEADQDHVGYSCDSPRYSIDVTVGGVSNILESMRSLNVSELKFFQPVSATMFDTRHSPQNETTPLNPTSPYACAKAHSFHLVRHYRESYGVFACTAIMYNHESPRRGEGYLLQKIVRAVNAGRPLELYNVHMPVDIGYAKEYMEAAHDIMQLDEPDDFVLATEREYKISYLATAAYAHASLPSSFTAVESSEPESNMIGDISKAQKAFGFAPKVHGAALIKLLMEGE